MKNFRKIFSIIGIAIALSLAVVPLAGWTSAANADEAETPVETAAIGGVQPLFGGDYTTTLEFTTGYVEFFAAAGNWIWPYADEAVINVSANTANVSYGFEVTFVWTNANRRTHWYVPNDFNSITGSPLKNLELKNNKYEIEYVKNCNDSSLTGKPGDKWACDHIIVDFIARLGNEEKTAQCTVYF